MQFPIKSSKQFQPVKVSDRVWFDRGDGYLFLEQEVPTNDTAIVVTGHLGPLAPLTFNRGKDVRIQWSQPLATNVSSFKIEIKAADGSFNTDANCDGTDEAIIE
jgi:hypothetical protein